MRDKTLPASMTASISKLDAQEDVWSPYQSYLNDFERRRAGRDSGAAPPAISDERIEKGTDLIGTYTVESDEITGGMGSVWKVHHKEWGIDLAMKRPRRAFFEEAGPGRKKAFVEECSQWLRLGLQALKKSSRRGSLPSPWGPCTASATPTTMIWSIRTSSLPTCC